MILIYPIHTVKDNSSVTKTVTAMELPGRPTIGFPLTKARKLAPSHFLEQFYTI